ASHHCRASSAKARLSAPPETATTRKGRRSNGPRRSSRAANSASPSGVGRGAPAPDAAQLSIEVISSAAGGCRPIEDSSGAAQPLLLGRRAVADLRLHLREVALEPRVGAAGIVLLAEDRQRDAELQQVVGRLGALRIFLVALGEGGGRALIILARIEGLAEPVLRIAGERVPRIALDEGAEGLLGLLVARLPQQREGRVVLVERRASGGLRWQARDLPAVATIRRHHDGAEHAGAGGGLRRVGRGAGAGRTEPDRRSGAGGLRRGR